MRISGIFPLFYLGYCIFEQTQNILNNIPSKIAVMQPFILEELTLQHLISRFGVIKCFRCKKTLRKGEKIISKDSHPRRYYHNSCWEEIHLEIPA